MASKEDSSIHRDEEKDGNIIAFRPAKGKASVVTSDQKVASYMDAHRVPIVAVTALVVAAVIGYTVAIAARQNATRTNLAKLDAVTRNLTADSAGLDEAALNERRQAAMSALEPLVKKGGVSGVRANMLAAEIAWQRGDYSDAGEYWKAAAAKSGKAYTAPITLFNEAAALAEDGKAAEAAELYGKAAEAEDFFLASCALFNQGNAYEACEEWEKAGEAYNGLIAKYPNDEWAKLARSALIALQISGKVE